MWALVLVLVGSYRTWTFCLHFGLFKMWITNTTYTNLFQPYLTYPEFLSLLGGAAASDGFSQVASKARQSLWRLIESSMATAGALKEQREAGEERGGGGGRVSPTGTCFSTEQRNLADGGFGIGTCIPSPSTRHLSQKAPGQTSAPEKQRDRRRRKKRKRENSYQCLSQKHGWLETHYQTNKMTKCTTGREESSSTLAVVLLAWES